MSLKRFYQENHVLNIVFSTFLSIKKEQMELLTGGQRHPHNYL